MGLNKNFYSKLTPRQKRMLSLSVVGASIVIFGILFYYLADRRSRQGQPVVRKENKVVSMDTGMLARKQLLDAKNEAAKAKLALEEEKKRQGEEKAKAAQLGETGAVKFNPAGPTAAGTVRQQPKMPKPAQNPFPTAPPPPNTQGPTKSPGAQSAAVLSESEIGGISVVQNERKTDKTEDKKKEERRSVFLPISYMEATLLSGLDAPTSSDAKGNPVPVLIRVKTPAVLPNDVKANLRGCFVVADGKGNLGTERAELVLVSLSCLDRRGQAVVDQPLTGYVVDSDGKAGLRGHVVTKMGAMVTRSMIAGLFGGFGDALKNANTTSSLSALGSVSTIKPEDMAMAGLGSGLSNAFKDIQKFYLDLAHQTMPVIEIGAARPITLVVTKGTSLEIKKIRGGKP